MIVNVVQPRLREGMDGMSISPTADACADTKKVQTSLARVPTLRVVPRVPQSAGDPLNAETPTAVMGSVRVASTPPLCDLSLPRLPDRPTQIKDDCADAQSYESDTLISLGDRTNMADNQGYDDDLYGGAWSGPNNWLRPCG